MLFISSFGYGQLTMEMAKDSAQKYHIGSYSYHEEFIGFKNYGAPIILTHDGGAAFFGGDADEKGSCATLVKLDTVGRSVWKRSIRPQFDELEAQSVVEDKNGNLYVFMLSFDHKKYRGGSQRIVCFNKKGTILWDKTIGKYSVMNNPIISYIKLQENGNIGLRGHIVSEKPVEGKDPVYHFWEGWITIKSELTQKTGHVIDWANQDWKKLFEPEK